MAASSSSQSTMRCLQTARGVKPSAASLHRSALRAAAAAPSSSASASSSSSSFTPLRLARPFHTSRPRRIKSPFQAFVDTLREELRKSQEMQENMRQLQGEAGKMQDSETMKRMREAYEKARIVTSIKENPRLQAAADALRKSGGHVGDAVGATLKQMEESELIKGLSAVSSRLARQLAESTAPVRNTEAYRSFTQTLTEAFDDGGSALRINTDDAADARQARHIKRVARLRKIGRPLPSIDPEELEKGPPPPVVAEDDVDLSAEQEGEPKEGESERVKDEAAENSSVEGSTSGSSASTPPAEAEATSSTQGQPQTDDPGPPPPPPPSQPKKPRKPIAGYAARVRIVDEDLEAGSALVLQPESASKKAWESFKSDNPLMRKLGDFRVAYGESENPVVERVRSITDTVTSWFSENETAQVVGRLRLLDPTFSLEAFQRDLREYIVPDIIDSYHGAVRPVLRQWCSEAMFNVLMATVEPYIAKGNTAHGRLLDVRNIEILHGRMLENDVPVLVVSFMTQELMYFKDAKTGEVKGGSEEQAQKCAYAMVFTRLEKELDNELTGGWKVVELARRGQGAWL